MSDIHARILTDSLRALRDAFDCILCEMGEPMEMADGAEVAELGLLFGDGTDDDEDEGWRTVFYHTQDTIYRRQPFPGMTHGNSVPPSVIDDLGVRMGNLEYEHGALVKKMGDSVGDGITGNTSGEQAGGDIDVVYPIS
ncbi:hypothetical protein Tco_1477539 [Tanacetum coccineum]